MRLDFFWKWLFPRNFNNSFPKKQEMAAAKHTIEIKTMHHAVVQKQNNISFCMCSEPGCPTLRKKNRQRGNITLSIMKKKHRKNPKRN